MLRIRSAAISAAVRSWSASARAITLNRVPRLPRSNPPMLMCALPCRLLGADDLEVLVDEDVVRPVDADVVDLVLAVAQLHNTVDDAPRVGGQRGFRRLIRRPGTPQRKTRPTGGLASEPAGPVPPPDQSGCTDPVPTTGNSDSCITLGRRVRLWGDRRHDDCELSHPFTAVEMLEKLTVPASWHPKVAASRTAMRVLAMTTPGHCLATLDGKDRHDPNCGRMKDVTDTDHQTAPDGQRRQVRAGGAGAPAGPPRPGHRSCQATAAAE